MAPLTAGGPRDAGSGDAPGAAVREGRVGDGTVGVGAALIDKREDTRRPDPALGQRAACAHFGRLARKQADRPCRRRRPSQTRRTPSAFVANNAELKMICMGRLVYGWK